MSDTLSLALAWLAGVGLGGGFFGGLWWTVHAAMSSRRPGLWFLGSSVLRTSLVLAGFLLVCADHWERWLVCLLGFVLARPMVTRLTRGLDPQRAHVGHEAGHAP